MGQNVCCGFFILSLVLSFELLSATTSELCIQPPSTSDTSSSCACKTCGFATSQDHKLCVKGDIICIPANYSKFELPNINSATEVNVGIDIMDIQNVDDKQFTVTLNAFFVLRWTDRRIAIRQDEFKKLLTKAGSNDEDSLPIDVSFMREIWSPDAEIRNLKEFRTLNVLSKLEGLWLNKEHEILYAVASHITFICPMSFNSFPLDVQVCKFQVGSFNYDITKIIFRDEFISNASNIRSVLDYNVNITSLPPNEQFYVALTGNYSVAGFELTLSRKMMHYIVTCYLPSGMFVVVSWISFLVPPDIVPGRMALLVTVFLVLINIFNTITTNIPKADGLTAIEAWVIVCVLFVFGALAEYAGVLLKIKIAATRSSSYYPGKRGLESPVANSIVLANGNTILHDEYALKFEGRQSSEFKRAIERREKDDQNHAKLDMIFLIIFPIIFIIFNVIYWFMLCYYIQNL